MVPWQDISSRVILPYDSSTFCTSIKVHLSCKFFCFKISSGLNVLCFSHFRLKKYCSKVNFYKVDGWHDSDSIRDLVKCCKKEQNCKKLDLYQKSKCTFLNSFQEALQLNKKKRSRFFSKKGFKYIKIFLYYFPHRRCSRISERT